MAGAGDDGAKAQRARGDKPGPVIASYDYQDIDGAAAMRVTRHQPKTFRQWRPDGRGGWVPGAPLSSQHRYLPYRLPELIEAIELGHPVLIVEGEKDVEAAARLGIAATCNAGGASRNPDKPNWRPEHAAHLRGADIVIVPDNDENGRAHAIAVGRSLQGIAERVRVLTLPDQPPKRDLTDWVEAGGTAEHLWALVEQAPTWTPPSDARDPSAVAAEGDAAQQQGDFVLVRRQMGERSPGVYFIDEPDKDGNRPWCWVCSLLEPLADSRDSESMNWGCQLEVVDGDGKRHVWVMPNEMGPSVGDGTDFRRELVRRGLRIAGGGKARNRLSDYITMWKPGRKIRCVPTVGWHGDAFVMPDRAYGGTEDVVMQTVGPAPDFGVVGTIEGWREDIATKCAGNSLLTFAVSAAFAGPLLKLAGEESGGVHFRGASSIGKTTALHAARSVWGTPIGSWRTTDNSAEGIAAAACDALLTLDEIGQANPRVVGELAYMLGNGRGKGRMRRDATMRQVHRWRMLFLSTGELGVAARIAEGGDKARAGQEVRVLELQADAGKGIGIFERLHGFGNAAQLAEHLRLAADRNCGHAARTFLEHITANKGELASTIVEARTAFMAEICPEGADGQVRRACGRFAIIGIAGEVATQAGITGWRAGEAKSAAVQLFNDWLVDRGGSGAAEMRQAFEQVRLFLEQHGESRFAPAWNQAMKILGAGGGDEETRTTNRPTINRAGFRKVSGDGTTYYILPEVWRREVCKGLDAKAVAAAMVERGWMLPGDGRNAAQKPHIPGEGKLRVYVIPPAFLSAPENDGADA